MQKRPIPAALRATSAAVLTAAAMIVAPAVSVPAEAQQALIEELRDPQNRLIGKIVTRSDGSLEARDQRNRPLGTYDRQSGVTYDENNRVVGRGNFLPALIDRAARESASGARNERLNREGSSRGWQEGDAQYQPRYQHQVMPGPATGERPIIPPDVKARQGRMAPAVTQEDRYFAIDALQKAAKQRGREVLWRNPDSRNSGAYVVTNETFESSMHGVNITCYWAIMTLRAANDIDRQRQGICQRPDNNIWVVVTVDADAF